MNRPAKQYNIIPRQYIESPARERKTERRKERTKEKNKDIKEREYIL